MPFINKYPYTDMENLNLDWVIKTINRVDTDLSTIKKDCERIARETAQNVADQLIIEVNQKIHDLTDIVNNLENDFAQVKRELTDDFNAYVTLIDNKIRIMQNQLNAFSALIDTKISANNAYLINEISNNFASVINVRNFFTGTMVTLQYMLDTLAALHVTDGLSYTELTNKNISYAGLTALNFSYEDLLMHGNSLIP